MQLVHLTTRTGYVLTPQRFAMEDQYGSLNAGDYDVVRSTQFADDIARGVSVFPIEPYFGMHALMAISTL